MSKPKKPGELTDVNVDAISLVSKAANGERFKIFKSADDETEDLQTENVEKSERGLFRILKDFFIKKGEVAEAYNSARIGEKVYDAFAAFNKVLKISRYDEGSITENDPAKVIAAVDDFRNVLLNILLGDNNPTKIEKAGRKISSSNLGKLKQMQEIFVDLLNNLDENETDNDDDTVNVQKAVESVLAPVIKRIEKIENARGLSNKLSDDSTVQKSSDDFWGGIF